MDSEETFSDFDSIFVCWSRTMYFDFYKALFAYIGAGSFRVRIRFHEAAISSTPNLDIRILRIHLSSTMHACSPGKHSISPMHAGFSQFRHISSPKSARFNLLFAPTARSRREVFQTSMTRQFFPSKDRKRALTGCVSFFLHTTEKGP